MGLTASTWRCISEALGDVDVTNHGTTQLYPLGHRIVCVDTSTQDRGEAEFIYHGGLDATTAGDVVLLDGDLTLLGTTRSVGIVGIAMSACVTGEYGWYQIRGQAVCNSAQTVADNAQAYLTSANTVDDAVVAGDEIVGARTMGASSTTPYQTLVLIMYPRTIDNDRA